MNSPGDPILTRERLWKMQIILSAIVGGALICAIVALVMRQSGVMRRCAEQPIVSYTCSAFAVIALILFPIITRKIVREKRWKIYDFVLPAGCIERKGPSYTAALLASFRIQMIVGAAILDGATFALILAFLVDATSWTLIGAIVPLAVSALQFPTRARLERWLDEQRELMRRELAGIDY
jgi:hypothetical protein